MHQQFTESPYRKQLWVQQMQLMTNCECFIFETPFQIVQLKKIRFISTKRLSQAQKGRIRNLVSVQNHKIAIDKMLKHFEHFPNKFLHF